VLITVKDPIHLWIMLSQASWA